MSGEYDPDDEDFYIRCPGCGEMCPDIQPARVEEYMPHVPGGYPEYDDEGNTIGWVPGPDLPGETEYEPVYICPQCGQEFYQDTTGRYRLTTPTDTDQVEECEE